MCVLLAMYGYLSGPPLFPRGVCVKLSSDKVQYKSRSDSAWSKRGRFYIYKFVIIIIK